MDGKRRILLSMMISLFMATSCFDAPPVFSRLPINLFRESCVYGVYVAEFNYYDTLILSNDGFIHIVYDKHHVKVREEKGTFTPFVNPLWEDPFSFFDNYSEYVDDNLEYCESDSTWYFTNLYMTKMMVGQGYDGSPRKSVYFVPHMKLYDDISEVDKFYYRKID